MSKHYNLGVHYFNSGRWLEAIEEFKAQIAEVPFKEAWFNLGSCYWQIGDLAAAEDCYIKCADFTCQFADGTVDDYEPCLINLGIINQYCGNAEAAIDWYKLALDANPTNEMTVFRLGLATLKWLCAGKKGNWDLAWKMWEYKYRLHPEYVPLPLKKWDLVSSGQKIMIRDEEGMGDKIMYGRYIHLLEKYFKEIYIQCDKTLWPLFSRWTPCAHWSDAGEDAVYISIAELPKIFGTKVDELWLDHIKDHEFIFPKDKYNIGIVWTGCPKTSNNNERSIDPKSLEFLNEYGNVYNLNPAVSHPGFIQLNPKDWAETYAYIKGLDIVISVDTSVVHLAGSMGKECLLLQGTHDTCWRWGFEGEGNIWYKSVRVFRNKDGWEDVLNRVKKEFDVDQ